MQHEITAGNGFGPRSASGEVGRHEVQGVATHHSGGREHRPDVGLSPEGYLVRTRHPFTRSWRMQCPAIGNLR